MLGNTPERELGTPENAPEKKLGAPENEMEKTLSMPDNNSKLEYILGSNLTNRKIHRKTPVVHLKTE
ncbi:hypothetical protein [Syntrophaceticus schinkii]|jgi:hypothetical protein|uniref:ATP-dependent Clp protease adapter protein ClpS n=1 Tax=Syntrophaceticus schinkii TaxID=499207 RepID=A0A0B7MIL1_9FIRM|nr:hypothetical protein [Syntrophaceticus schinkii]CEO87786.1 ATP-dependent Clp protease adapter protein ClpS [Syntrophaceticus schinkii]